MIGKRNLERALGRVPRLRDVDVRVTWRPYLLTPASTWSLGSVNKRQFYLEKFGEERMRAIEPRLRRAFAEAGIENFSMGGDTGPTLDAHRLLAYAESLDHTGAMQNNLMEGLFKRYFTMEKAPCDAEALIDAAREAGVPNAAEVLADKSRFLLEVEEQMRAYARGVNGVPHFILSNGSKRLTFGGAQPSETFEDAFEELLAR